MLIEALDPSALSPPQPVRKRHLAECNRLILSTLEEIFSERPLLLEMVHLQVHQSLAAVLSSSRNFTYVPCTIPQSYPHSRVALMAQSFPRVLAQALPLLPTLFSTSSRDCHLIACHIVAHLALALVHVSNPPQGASEEDFLKMGETVQWRYSAIFPQIHASFLLLFSPDQVVAYIDHIQSKVGGSVVLLREAMEVVAILGGLFPTLRCGAVEILERSLTVAGPLVEGRALGDPPLLEKTVAALEKFGEMLGS